MRKLFTCPTPNGVGNEIVSTGKEVRTSIFLRIAGMIDLRGEKEYGKVACR
jgi:hypothetical protein